MERFEVLRTLGSGGGGRVVLAKEAETGKQVAIKEITLDPKRKTKTKEAVQKEAKILGQLKHPHVVSMLESFLDKFEEKLYIVQDFCDGGTLQDQVALAKANNIPLQEHQIMQWFVQVAMAVHHIHSKKILHRDLKSQNVFLTKKGVHSVVKIGDFGIARMMESTIDMAQTCCGTPCYLSPELCQDMPYSSKADVWALGCLLFEMCALRYAFDASNIVSLFYKIVKGEPGEIPPQYSSSIRELIQVMLSKVPDGRPSAGAILNLPYIQEHLTVFIKEKENLQEARHARHLLKTTGGSTKSPDIQVRPSSSCDSTGLTPDSNKKNHKPRAKSAHPLVKNQTVITQDKDDRNEEKGNGGKASDNQAEESSEYSDDFDESDDDDYLDDSEEGANMNSSLKRPMSSDSTPEGNGEAEPDTNDMEYPDDFEEDSDDEEDEANTAQFNQGLGEALDNLLANARAAQDAEVIEEEVVEDSDRPVSCRERLKEHVIDALGEKVFEEVCERFERSRKEGNVAERAGIEFEKLSGSEIMETCYLVNELFIDNPEAQQSTDQVS